jgi:maltose alpha-D-glucosyltransferase/alpha-amylase
VIRKVSSDLWWRDAIVYCLDVETFLDTDGDGCGDLGGVIERIDYLAGMGVTCMWLMPFFPTAGRDDGYDITDFYAVDPRLGTLGDFTEMVRTASDRGIRVVADLVVNHTSIEHPWFQSARSSPGSPYRDWYVWSDDKPREKPGDVVFPDQEDSNWAFDEAAGQWYLHRFYAEQPDLNVANPRVRDEIAQIAGFWLQQGLAGFRVDAVPFLIEPVGMPEGAIEDPHELLADLRAYLGRRRGDAILLGEVNLPPADQAPFFGAGRRELDMMFDFHAMQAMYLSLAREDAGPLAEALGRRCDAPDGAGWAVFVRNHDELTLDQLGDDERQEVFDAFGPDEDLQVFGRGLRMRLPTMLGGDGRRIRMVYSLAFSLPGAPVLFYGEEIGMGENRDIPGRMAVRSPMQWSDGPNGGFSEAPAGEVHRPVNRMPGFDPPAVNVAAQRRDEGSLLNWFERLIRRRRESPEIGHGAHRLLPTGDPAVLAHRCDWEGRAIVAVHNLAGRGARVDLSGFGEEEPRALEDLFGRRDAVAGPGATLDLEPYGFRWFALGGGVAEAGSGNQTGTEAVGRRQTMPTRKEDLPGTIARSPKKVQRTYAKTLDAAHEQYDSEERAHRTAFASVKHIAERIGDHWELKDEPGPSDPQSMQSGRAARDRPKKTYGGVDVIGNTKDELYERARKLGVKGRSKMSKTELAEAIAARQ